MILSSLSFLVGSYGWETLPKSFKGNYSPFKKAKLRHYKWKQLAQYRQEMNSQPLESSPGNYCLDHPSSLLDSSQQELHPRNNIQQLCSYK